MVGIRWFPFEMAYVQVRTVTFREGTLDWNIALDWNDWLCLEYFPYTFRCEIKRWTLEAQNGMGTNVYSLAANWTFFRRKTVLEKMDLHSSTRTLGTYTQIYIYMQHHKFCVYLIWSHLQIETAHHHSSTCQYKKQVHFEIIAIQTSKHPNTLGCQNLTIRFLVALD